MLTAVYDSCVLYPAPLRDLLLELARSDLFRAKWSPCIHKEWMAAVCRNRPDLNMERLERTRSLMDQSVRDALVTGYEDLISCLSLPDENDRHVMATAIRCRADVIVTYNLKDFPAAALSKFSLEAQHPDEFVSHLMNWHTGSVVARVRNVRARLKKPPKDVQEYLDCLQRQGLVKFVAMLMEYGELL